MELFAPKIGAQQINANALPGELGAAAHALATWMARTGWASTPIEARLQVGLIALGQRPEEVASRIEALARKMIQQLRRWPALAVAVHRILLARRPLPIALGESVYPTSTPIAVRWRTARGLRPQRSGRRLVSWAPGRVVDSSSTGVTVVVAPTSDEAQQLSLDAETWRRLSGEPPEHGRVRDFSAEVHR